MDGEDFDKHTIKKFLKESLHGLKLKAIITDGHQAYTSIIKALGAIDQKCIFHKMQSLMKNVIKTMKKVNRKITTHENKIKKNKIKSSALKDKNRQKYSSKIKKLKKENTKSHQKQ